MRIKYWCLNAVKSASNNTIKAENYRLSQALCENKIMSYATIKELVIDSYVSEGRMPSYESLTQKIRDNLYSFTTLYLTIQQLILRQIIQMSVKIGCNMTHSP